MLKKLWATIKYNWFLGPKTMVTRGLHDCKEAGCYNSSRENGVNTLGNKTNSKGV